MTTSMANGNQIKIKITEEKMELKNLIGKIIHYTRVKLHFPQKM